MKAVIIGGGKVGYYLLKSLLEKKYDVTLIEKNKDVCIKIAEDFNADIICGDGTDVDVLKDAGIEDAQIAAAVTGKDEENFVICQTIKLKYKSTDTIARINNPKNSKIFKALGIDKTVCSTEVISNIIESGLSCSKFRVVQSINMGEMILAEVNVNNSGKWYDKKICSIDIPEGCIIVSILRGGRAIAPSGSITIKAGDKVLVTLGHDREKAFESCI